MSDPKSQPPMICNCQRTMEIDGARLATALGQTNPLPVHTELCRSGIASFEAAVSAGGTIHVACTQEAPLFREIAGEAAAGDVSLTFTNIRENAGWCEKPSAALPKIAALLAEAAHPAEPARSLTLNSGGMCLVYGAGEIALDVARRLEGRLQVTVLMTDPGDAIPPSVAEMAIARGRIKCASGHLGAFDVVVDGYAPALPSSRAQFDFAMARNGAHSRCDLILDLSGGTALFSSASRRDGYVAADPADAAAVARAMFEISDMVGEFEKPIYVDYDAGICAHARSAKVGCRNCLDHCPLGAITPAGDNVAIDAAICGGCGNCAAVCPTGAASYAYPRREDILARAAIMLETFAKAGGKMPVILLHDEAHGRRMIDAMARFGRGLPANVLPLALNSTLQAGHEILASLLALGAAQVAILVPTEHPEELAAMTGQLELADTFLSALGVAMPRLHMIRESDPFVIDDLLHELPSHAAVAASRFTFSRSKREAARTALTKLNAAAPSPQQVIPLPAGAPYGRIAINADGCTLCLACVGACPTGALADNPDRPEVRFTESACVQCGICRATCPERVIALEPRYDFTSAALTPVTLHGEEPFHCVSCGKAFGTKATIERVMDRLKSHSMFPNEAQLAIIQMCDTCRVVAVAERSSDPYRGNERPRVRTTEDYLAEAAADRTNAAEGDRPKAKKPEDFLG
ncbi:MAG: 4Fe-4S dicluster domain-containing protein [Hyphomicrobiaceae bacterium]|nr:4Fe-4S dicluster domain-containing protein [Hyphomicrobiaceae bacterium]